MKKKLLCCFVSVILCATIFFSSVLPSAAADGVDVMSIIGSILSGKKPDGKINLANWFWNSLDKEINKEGFADKWVENLKKVWRGEDPRPEEEERTKEISDVDAKNAAELFNITVNEIKSGRSTFTKTSYENIPYESLAEMKENSIYATALISAVTNNTDIAAALIKAKEGKQKVERTERFNPDRHDVKDFVSVSGRDYVSLVEPEDIVSCSMRFSSKGRYSIHLEFRDVYSNDPGSLIRIFDFPDTDNNKYLHFTLGGAKITDMQLKYTGLKADVSVDRHGNVSKYSTEFTSSPAFKQDDGTYATWVDIPFYKDTSNIKLIKFTELSKFKWRVRILGDTDSDGAVTAADARNILRASALGGISEKSIPYYDVDGDGKITAADARIVLRYSASLEDLPKSDTVPTVGGLYIRGEKERDKIAKLILLMAAYQEAKDENERKELERLYEESKNKEQETSDSGETADPGPLNSGEGKAGEVLDIIGKFGGILSGIIGNRH